MRRRDLAPEELDKVKRLKQIGTSWLGIERETGISRRKAKHAWEKWERSQSLQELKEARKDVAAELFHRHLEDFSVLAMSLATHFTVPSSPNITTNAEFFSELWQQDLLHRWSSPQWSGMDRQFIRSENELLFKSLQDHIRGEVRWNAFDEWKNARENCAKVLGNLRKEAPKVVNNFVNLERESNLLYKVKEENIELNRDPVKQMMEAALNAIWQGILEDKLGQDLVRMVLWHEQGLVQVRNETFIWLADTGLAEKVTHMCNLVANNLSKGEKSHMVESLQNEVRIMKRTSEELRAMLNPVKLTPIILRTRCELCPA